MAVLDLISEYFWNNQTIFWTTWELIALCFVL